MGKTVPASKVQKEFGHWSEEALQAPVAIQRHGRDALYLISKAEYQRLKSLEHLALGAEDLTDEEARLIQAAEYGA